MARRCRASSCPHCQQFPSFSTLLERRIRSSVYGYTGYVAWLHRTALNDKARTLAEYQPKPADFNAERERSAGEKARTVRAYIQFAASGFEARLFIKAVNEEMRLHCGFIAHYDRHGFYAEYFARLHAQRQFIREISGGGGLIGIDEQNPFDTAQAIRQWTIDATKAGLFFQTPAKLRPPDLRFMPKAQVAMSFA